MEVSYFISHKTNDIMFFCHCFNKYSYSLHPDLGRQTLHLLSKCFCTMNGELASVKAFWCCQLTGSFRERAETSLWPAYSNEILEVNYTNTAIHWQDTVPRANVHNLQFFKLKKANKLKDISVLLWFSNILIS